MRNWFGVSGSGRGSAGRSRGQGMRRGRLFLVVSLVTTRQPSTTCRADRSSPARRPVRAARRIAVAAAGSVQSSASCSTCSGVRKVSREISPGIRWTLCPIGLSIHSQSENARLAILRRIAKRRLIVAGDRPAAIPDDFMACATSGISSSVFPAVCGMICRTLLCRLVAPRSRAPSVWSHLTRASSMVRGGCLEIPTFASIRSRRALASSASASSRRPVWPAAPE